MLPKLSESKLTMADLRLIAIVAENQALAAVLARGNYELARKIIRTEDGEIVEFTDEDIAGMRIRRPFNLEPVDGDHRRLRRTCYE